MSSKITKNLVSKLFVAIIVCLLTFQCFCIQSETNLQAQDQVVSPKKESRLLQSSLLGFDLSRISSSSFGGYGSTSGSSQQSTTKAIPVTQLSQQSKTSTQTSLQSSTSSSQPLEYKKISNNQFSNITLYHEVPTKFLLNEIYTFKGMAKAPASKVNLIMSLVIDGSVRISVSQSLNGLSEFQIPVNMSFAGKFYLTMFTGSSGQTTRTEYEIIERQQYRNYDASAPKTIDQLSIFQKDNKIYVKWSNFDGSRYPITKLIFEQYSTLSKVEFIFSNFEEEVVLPLKNFVGFQPSTVSLAAVQAKSSTSSAPSRLSEYSIPKMIFFDAQQHCFSQNRTDLASFDSFSYIFSPDKGMLTITGRALSKLKNEIVVLDPSKTFKSYLINGALGDLGQVPINTYISLTINISQQGVYIIEINHSAGYAVLNRPIYVGRNIIPLIPDSQDLKDTSRSPVVIVSQQPTSIYEQRNMIFNLINEKRAEFGLGSVSLDDKLNQLAQQHTDDMVKRSYSSHYSPQGLGPTDRARNNKIYEEIGQNIGMNSDITDAHYRLCRSNIHLRNIVNPKWVRVGLGVKLNSNNSFIVTQEFSTKDLTKDPLSQSDLSKIKSDIISHIIYTVRVVRGQNLDLSTKMSAWHDTRPAATSSQLTSFIKTLKYSSFSGIVMKVAYSTQSVDAIKNSKVLIPSSTAYTQVGLSVKFNNGNLQVYIGYVS